MKTAPNLNHIAHLIAGWQKSVVSIDEVRTGILRALEPEHQIPEAEIYPEPPVSGRIESALAILTRVEAKLNAILRHQQTPLPAEFDPRHVMDDVLELARTNKIAAIKVQRDRTGAGLAEAKNAIEEHLGKDRPNS